MSDVFDFKVVYVCVCDNVLATLQNSKQMTKFLKNAGLNCGTIYSIGKTHLKTQDILFSLLHHNSKVCG